MSGVSGSFPQVIRAVAGMTQQKGDTFNQTGPQKCLPPRRRKKGPSADPAAGGVRDNSDALLCGHHENIISGPFLAAFSAEGRRSAGR